MGIGLGLSAVIGGVMVVLNQSNQHQKREALRRRREAGYEDGPDLL
jgi:hypothetical protein